MTVFLLAILISSLSQSPQRILSRMDPIAQDGKQGFVARSVYMNVRAVDV
jgi:hypothetical protein